MNPGQDLTTPLRSGILNPGTTIKTGKRGDKPLFFVVSIKSGENRTLDNTFGDTIMKGSVSPEIPLRLK